MKWLIPVLLIISLVFITGCTQQKTTIPVTTTISQSEIQGQVTDQAEQIIDQEIQQAVENATTQQVENAIIGETG